MRTELVRLNPERIVVVGGTGVVSRSVATALRQYTDRPVIRLGGADRYATSRLIAEYAFGNREVSEAYIATGLGFPDALSAAAAAAGRGAPVILVPGGASNAGTATRSLLLSFGLDDIYVAGGTGVVSRSMATWLNGIAPTSRLSGVDRFGTSLAINQHAHSSATDAHLAYAYDFPDALAGSVLAGVRGGPMYSVERTCVPGAMLDHMASIGVEDVTLFGGTGVLRNGVASLSRC